MSKTIMIPDWMDPYVVHVNGLNYVYKAGETISVPDGVAAIIQADIDAHKAANEQGGPQRIVRSVNGVAPDENGNVEMVPCITASGAPTTATAGAVGSLYMDTATGDLYKCITSEPSVSYYVWVNVATLTLPVYVSRTIFVDVIIAADGTISSAIDNSGELGDGSVTYSSINNYLSSYYDTNICVRAIIESTFQRLYANLVTWDRMSGYYGFVCEVKGVRHELYLNSDNSWTYSNS